jgi:hypothetical protein
MYANVNVPTWFPTISASEKRYESRSERAGKDTCPSVPKGMNVPAVKDFILRTTVMAHGRGL